MTETSPTQRINGVLVWIDVETTGLEARRDRLLEIGLVATTPDLEPIDNMPEFSACISPAGPLDLMKLDPRIVSMHTNNGLFEDLREHSLPSAEVERRAGVWFHNLGNYGEPPYVAAGSTVSFDRRFLKANLPKLHDTWLHYRSIDVSSVKELVRRWYGEDALPKFLEDPKEHRPIPDIMQSIRELDFYRKCFFVEQGILKGAPR